MEQIERTAENMKNDIKETTNDIGPSIKNNIENIQNNTFSNFSLDNFFFFFTRNVEEVEVIQDRGFQKLLVQTIAFFSLLCSITYFISSLNVKEFFYKGLYYITACVLFLIIAFYSFYSTINHNSNYTKIAYLLSALIWCYSFIFWFFDALIHLFHFLNFFGDEFLYFKEVSRDIGEGCALLVFYCCVDLLYCYMIDLRTGRAV
jgi:hypothetical protein